VQSGRGFYASSRRFARSALNCIFTTDIENRDPPFTLNIERSLSARFFLRGVSIMIEVGKLAPDFELASHLGGTKFTLSQFKGQKNVMLVFYPLDWTPT
jgi:hypothetical protein